MKWDPDIMVRAILMLVAGIGALVLLPVLSTQFINQAILSSLVLAVGLVLIVLGILAAIVAFVKGDDRDKP